MVRNEEKRLQKGIAFVLVLILGLSLLMTSMVSFAADSYGTYETSSNGTVPYYWIRIQSDGSYSSTQGIARYKVTGSDTGETDAYCAQLHHLFSAGMKTEYDMLGWTFDGEKTVTQTMIDRVALGMKYIDELSYNTDLERALKQAYEWRIINNDGTGGGIYLTPASSGLSIDQQKSIFTAAQEYADENASKYTCWARVYSSGDSQDIAQYFYRLTTGHMTLTKSSANTTITSGNSCYDLTGATYAVYTDTNCSSAAKDVNGDKVVLTCKSDGTTNTPEMEAGTYYVKETKAGSGYKLDSSVYSVTVEPGETATVAVKDEPLYDSTGIKIYKIDAETGEADPQGGATLAGAEFTVKFYAGDYSQSEIQNMTATKTWTILTEEINGEYVASLTDALPLGTYTIQETSAPTGYLIEGNFTYGSNTAVSAGDVFYTQLLDQGSAVWVSGGNAYTESDTPIRGGVQISKYDADLHAASAQGDATLTGAKFEIVNENNNSVEVDGKSYQSGEVVMTIETDDNYVAKTADDALPYGTYTIREVASPTGYLIGDDYARTFKIQQNGVVVLVEEVEDPVIRGGVQISKYDDYFHEAKAQGDATLAGAKFEIINESKKSVVVDGKAYETGDVVMTITTNDNGVAKTADDALPYGTYMIRETKSPEGYLFGEDYTRTFTIRENGVVVLVEEVEDPVIRGGVEIQKRDLESYRTKPQGNATFEGITLKIVNQSPLSVVVDDVEYQPGEVVMTLTTDENGHAVTAADALPYGSYTVIETETSEGYLLGNDSHTDISQEAVLSIDFVIRTDGEIVDLTGGSDSILDPDQAITDMVKRGDIALVKQDGENQSTDLGSVPFRITSQTTGESHVFWTDENGDYSSDSTWNKHTYKTNLGEDDTDGIWFFGYADWEDAGLEYVDDALGALPYDRYDLDELPCDNNKGMELIHTEFTVSRDIRVINLGTLDNYLEPVPEIGTTLINDWTGEHQATIFENHTISLTDTVEYSNLKEGETYTVKGVLMDKETGEPLLNHEGEEVWAEATFTAEDTEGTVEVTYEFDANGLHGTETVAFEYLYDAEGELMASHEDIDDGDQTVELLLPTLWTYAAETLSGRKAIEAKDDVSITDMLYLSGLIPGHTYYVYGRAVDPETGELILDHNGDPLEMVMEFVADAEEMTLDIMEFHFNASDLAGKSVVFEEYLYADADRTILITEEEDLGSPEQTVYFFGDILLGTTLVDEETDSHVAMADDHVTLIDTVEYEGATVGETYTVTGTLMDQETGLAITDKDGNEITTESEPFTAEEETGTVEVTFEFDASDLAGDSVVAYEFMYNSEGTLVGAHEDINDEGQTVNFPEIGTTLLDEETETHYAIADESITLIDTVVYEGLIPGETYKLTGTLMNKDTGEELTDADGNPITSEVEFTAEDAEGVAEVVFTFDGSDMEGMTTVAYEYLYDVNGNLIASHEDLDDEAQTVGLVTEEVIEELENDTPEDTPEDTPATLSSGDSGSTGNTPKTGDTTNAGVWVAIGIGGLAAAAGAAIGIRKKKNLRLR